MIDEHLFVVNEAVERVLMVMVMVMVLVCFDRVVMNVGVIAKILSTHHLHHHWRWGRSTADNYCWEPPCFSVDADDDHCRRYCQ